MKRGLALLAGFGLIALSLISTAKGQAQSGATTVGSQDAVFKFRLLGPTTDLRAKLSDERRWQTRDQQMLAGQALVSRQAGHVEIERVNYNGPGPSRVTVALASLTDSDQATLRAAWLQVKPEARRLGFLVPFAVKPEWSNAEPKIANRYTRAIAVEPNQVIFRSGNELYAVPKAAFTQSSYDVIAAQFADHHRGRYVHLDGTLTSVFGKLLLESESDFIFEAIDPPLIPGSLWQGGQRFRVPKIRMSKQQVEDLQLIMKRFPLQHGVGEPEPSQFVSLPCLRMLDGIPQFCESDPAKPDALLYLAAQGQKRSAPLVKLTNRDHLMLTQESLAQSQPGLSKQQLEAAALEKMIAMGRQRERWECANGSSSFPGRLRGRIGDVYFFDQLDSPAPFYALPAQLSEIDKEIIAAVGQQPGPDWITKIDLLALFSKRLMVNNGYALIVQIGTRSLDVSSAFQGPLPVVQYATNIDYPWPALDLVNIGEIERSRKFLAENKANLTARDMPQLQIALQSLTASKQIEPTSTDRTKSESKAASAQSLVTPLPVLPKRDVWNLVNTSSTFIGELVGEHEGDWVFEQMVNDERKYYLASPNILTPQAKRKGDAILKRVKPRTWDELLARASNWQYFRVWYDTAGKVRSVTNPVVVLSISDTLIRFQHLDGSTTSDKVPTNETGQEALVAFFEPAFAEGRKLRSRAEEGLTLWKFRDCEPTQRATLIGESAEDILVKDSRNVEFLINKACLDASSITELNQLRENVKQLRIVSDEQAQSLPRIWCTRTRLIGPAAPVFMTLDGRLELLFSDGTRDFINIESLTLRERLAYENQWRRYHGLSRNERNGLKAKDAATVLDELRTEVADKDKITSLPALRSEIVQAIDENLAQWEHVTWPSTPIQLAAKAKLLAINEDATFGVVEEKTDGWFVVELSSGKRKLIRPRAESTNPKHGKRESDQALQVEPSPANAAESTEPPAPLWAQPCWMHRGAKVFWLEGGQIHVSGPDVDSSKALTALPQSIVAASQSTDYSALVLLLADSSTYRFDLATHTVRLLAAAPDPTTGESRPQAASLILDQALAPPTNSRDLAPRVWASTDGTAFTTFANNAILVRVPPLNENEAAGQAFLATNKVPLHVAASRGAAFIQADQTGSLSKLAVSITTPAPTRVGMPFNPRWFGIVKWQSPPGVTGSDVEKEVIQVIGKPDDVFFDKANYFFVHQHRLDGDYHKYAYQYVQGEMNDQMRVAANGSALVHHRDGKFVVSRRPPVIPVVLRAILYPYIRSLVANHDIGQLEALGRYLEQSRFQSQEGFPGYINHHYQDLVKIACFEYQPELGGDRLERAIALADHMWRKYPASQVAGNVLVDIHRGLAWSARGGGYAGSVTEAGWDSFRREMKIAKDYTERLIKMSKPMAATFRSAIDIEMATTQSLAGPRGLAVQLLKSEHAADPQLQHAMAFMLLPRWHGAPGMSEAYLQTVSNRVPKPLSNEVYAQQVALLMPMLGYAEPVTNQVDIDLEKVLQGTKDYYSHRIDGNLLDTVILILAVEQKDDSVRELLELRAKKRMLPSATAALHAQSFRNIEAKCGK